jgi:hypothetical protein
MTTDAEARAALAEIEHGRRLVIDEIDAPAWYWWGLAVGWVAVGVVADLHDPWASTAATVAFGALHASLSGRVIGGRRRSDQVTVRREVAGRHTPLIVVCSLVLAAVVTVGLALAAHADGARHPATAASVVVGLLVLAGGPRVMARVRRRAVRREVA